MRATRGDEREPTADSGAERVGPRIVASSRVPPVYPADAARRGIRGRVVVRATVLEDGSVADPTLVEFPDGGRKLGEAAVAALLEWRYEPATVGGIPVEHALLVTFEFGN